MSFPGGPRAGCEGRNEESQITTNAFPRGEIPPLRCTQGRACPAEARENEQLGPSGEILIAA